MKKNWFAFIGSDKYDIVIEYAALLTQLGGKVIVFDITETREIFYSMPNPYSNTSFENNQVMYSNDLSRIDERTSAYDYVLFDFGYNVNDELVKQCEKVIYVTDQQAHHLTRLTEFISSYYNDEIHFDKKTLKEQFEKLESDDCTLQKRLLVIKDFVSSKYKRNFILAQVGNIFPENNVHILFYDEGEYGRRLDGQHTQHFVFKGSSDVKELMFDILPNEVKSDSKALKKAYARAERGK